MPTPNTYKTHEPPVNEPEARKLEEATLPIRILKRNGT